MADTPFHIQGDVDDDKSDNRNESDLELFLNPLSAGDPL